MADVAMPPSNPGDSRSVQAAIGVCGMTVEISDDTIHQTYDGTTYYFCSPACRDQFIDHPLQHTSPLPQTA